MKKVVLKTYCQKTIYLLQLKYTPMFTRLILLIISTFTFFICTAQNVGIGTNLPTEPLTVYKTGIGISQQSGTTKPVKVGFYTDSTSGAYIQTHTKHNLKFTTADGPIQMVLDTLGRVGIGSPLPIQKLDVNGGIKMGASTIKSDGSIQYSVDSGFQAYENPRWNSMINNFDVVGSTPSGNEGFFYTSMIRNQYVNISELNYTVKKNGNYLIILGAIGSGSQEKNDIYNFSDNRQDFRGKIRLTRNNSSSSWILEKTFFYIHSDAADATQDPTWHYHSDDGEKSIIRYLTEGEVIQTYVYIEQAVGVNAPAQANNWQVRAQVKFILLN